MKGDVEMLVSLVDSYIHDLRNAITSLKIEGMAIEALSIADKVKLSELENRLKYVEYQKCRAIYVSGSYSIK